MFFHSSSYPANPVACAAAKANLDLWQNRESYERIASVVAMQGQGIEPFRADACFKNVRRTGTITALDLKVRGGGYLAGIGRRFKPSLTVEIFCCVLSAIRSMLCRLIAS